MHHIQMKILEKLIKNEKLRFRDLRPDGIESNHFVYHLKELIKDGLICKEDRYYTLTASGMAYTDRISRQTMQERLQPKIITMLDITNDKGETLIYRRKYQPYINRLGYPSGKVHMGEHIREGAQREVEEKIGFKQPVKLEHCGDVYVAISKDGFMISQVLGHVFVGRSNEELEGDQRFWADHTKLDQKEMLPGMPEIKRLIATGEFFFDEFFFEL